MAAGNAAAIQGANRIREVTRRKNPVDYLTLRLGKETIARTDAMAKQLRMNRSALVRLFLQVELARWEKHLASAAEKLALKVRKRGAAK
jgi:hypothetical protein